MTTTDLKPGDFVQHPERRLNGLVVNGDGETIRVLYLTSLGAVTTTSNLTGWERVETCMTEAVRILEDYQQIVSKSVGVVVRDAVVMMTPAVYEAHHGRETVRPGHVQVRVNDLDLNRWEGVFEGGGWNHATRVAIRAANAITAQRAESTPTADEPEIVGDGCECWVTPEHMWTTYGSAVEPGSQVEYNPRCPKHGEKPTSATLAATYECPWCSTDVTFTLSLNRNPRGGVMVWVAADGAHTCPPVQPDEPTEFGARIVVTDDLSGKAERWCRQHDEYWASENGALMTWAYLTQRGTVTLGWDE